MQIYPIAENLITSLGCTRSANMRALVDGRSGLRRIPVDALHGQEYCVSEVDRDALLAFAGPLNLPEAFTYLERMAATSISGALQDCKLDHTAEDVLVVLASTKGNIDLLDKDYPYPADHPIHLNTTAKRLAAYFGFYRTPVVLSHACTSGLMAVIYAGRLLAAGKYRYAIVSGMDVLSPFTLSGFGALGAIDPDPCRPYDAARRGINLGEGCGTMVLSASGKPGDIAIAGSGNSNDANHISGPSRTGAGLLQAIRQAMEEADVTTVDHISAHGTATQYNDEMEAQAFHQLGMQDVPLNSAKGYWGHTLGAAGIIELIALIACMRRNVVYPSAGYETNGLTLPLNIITTTQELDLRVCLKTSSGFGGSNSAVVVRKT